MSNAYTYNQPPRTEMHNGKIVMMAPASTDHNRTAMGITHIFRNYLKGKKCEYFTDGQKVHLSKKDRVVPDGMVVCNPDIIKYDAIHGAPDLIIEILSPSTAKYDRGSKKDMYEAYGVNELWLVHPADKTIEVHLLKDGKYYLDNVYVQHADYVIEDMTDQERAEIVMHFKTSIFDDLIISVEEVFEDLI